MLKIVIFDSGFGGDLFADYVESELPTIDVIRIIDWRAEQELLKGTKAARHEAERALAKYIGHVDLIMFANAQLSVSSLHYFRRKYKNQKFAGFSFEENHKSKNIFIMTTSATARSFPYRAATHRMNAKVKSFTRDEWIPMISDGDLSESEVRLALLSVKEDYHPDCVLIACSDFVDIEPTIRDVFGSRVRVDNGYKTALMNICKELGIRGRTSYKRRKK